MENEPLYRMSFTATGEGVSSLSIASVIFYQGSSATLADCCTSCGRHKCLSAAGITIIWSRHQAAGLQFNCSALSK